MCLDLVMVWAARQAWRFKGLRQKLNGKMKGKKMEAKK
jgi:hypothetical protein